MSIAYAHHPIEETCTTLLFVTKPLQRVEKLPNA